MHRPTISPRNSNSRSLSFLLLALGALLAMPATFAAPGEPGDALTSFGPRPIFTGGTKPGVIVDDFGWIDYTWSAQRRSRAAAEIAEWQASGIAYAAYYALGAVETSAFDELGDAARTVDLDGSVSNWCMFTRAAFRDYLIESGKLAVDLGASYLLLDNASPNLATLSFDDEILGAFRDHLASNYSTGELAAMGVPDAGTFDYRAYLRSGAGGSYTNSESLANSPPGNALWAAWNTHLREAERAFLTQWTGEIRTHAASAYSRTVYFAANRYTTARQWDNIDLLDLGIAETFLDNLGYPFRNLEAIYKNARNLGRRFWSWNFPANTGTLNGSNDPYGPLHITQLSKVFAAEAMAGGGLVQLPIDWVSYYHENQRLGDLAAYLRFPHLHPELFNLDQGGEVAVLYNEAHEIADEAGYTPSFRGAVLLLGDLRLTCDVLFAAHPARRTGDDPFASADLGRYQAILLPNARRLTGAQVAKLDAYLQAGGTVIGLGPVADLDEDGVDVSASRTFDDLFAVEGTTSAGSGTAIAFETDLGGDYYANAATQVAEGQWELTAGNETDLSTLRAEWAGLVDPLVSPDLGTSLSRLVHANRFTAEDGSHVYHLVNRDINLAANVDDQSINATPAASCSVAIPAGFTAGGTVVSWLTVEAPEPVVLTPSVNGSRLEFTLPSFSIWGVLKVGSAADSAQALDLPPQADFNLLDDTGGHRPDEIDATGEIAFNYWYWKGGNHGGIPWSIPFWASDDSEVDYVRLFYRFSPDQVSWGEWTLHSSRDVAGMNVADSFSFDAPEGEGHYQFRLQAVDDAAQEEVVTTRDGTGYGVDQTPPLPPASASVSGGHRSGSWISDVSSLTFSWDLPNDNLSGYRGANVSIVTDSYDVTDATLGNAETSWSPTLAGLAGGVLHHLRFRHEDAAGNWAQDTTIFSFYAGTAPVGELSGLAVAEGNGSLTVSWTLPVDPAFSHAAVFHRLAGDHYGEWISSGQTPDAATTSHAITGLQNGEAYEVLVVAHATGGQPGNQQVLAGSFVPSGDAGGGGSGPTIPAAPTNLAAVDNTANVRLTWLDQANNESGYVIERKLKTAASWTVVATPGENTQAFTDIINIGSDTYQYRVKAFGAAGPSEYSNTVTIKREGGGGSGPANHVLTVSAQPSSGGTITGGGAYPAGQSVQVQAAPAANYAFSHWSGAASGAANPATVVMTADFAVVAHFVAVPPPETLPTPSAPQLVSANATSVTFSWTIGSGALTGFQVERRASGGSFVALGQTASQVFQYTDSSLQPGGGYEYRIVALGASGESSPGAAAAFSTQSLQGYFLGALDSGAGHFGLVVDAAGTAFCLIDVAGADSLIARRGVTVDAEGNFSFGIGAIVVSGRVPFAVSSAPAGFAFSSAPLVLTVALPGTEPITGSAARETDAGAPTASTGYYQGVAGAGHAMGVIHNLVAPSGRVLVFVESSEGTLSSGLGMADAAGSFAVTLDNGLAVLGAFLAPTRTFSGTVTTPGGGSLTFASIGEGSLVETDRLVNISTRGPTASGTGNMIGGFVIQGGGPKQVLVTAKGPSLIEYGVGNALRDPRLTLFDGDSKVVHAVSSWRDEPNSAAILASGFAPESDLEAAMLLVLPPGAYTAVIDSDEPAATDSVSIVEVYEIEDAEVASTSRLVNISTRGLVGSGENVMIAGLVITGALPKTVLIDARGPSLAPYGISNYLADPHIRLVRIGEANEELGGNDDWQEAPEAAGIAATGYAPSEPGEPAMLVTLEPGVYTAIVSSAAPLEAGDMRVALVEVYEITP